MNFSPKLKYLAIATTLAIAFISLTLGSLIYLPADLNAKEPLQITVKNGQGVYDIAQTLQEQGLIKSQNVFVLYVKLSGSEKSLKAGKYSFSRRLSLYQIVNFLAKGLSEPADISITIPEGFNIWETDKQLTKAGLISEGQFSSEYYNDEGYLFPDTYRLKNYEVPITNDESDLILKELRDKMHINFQNKTEPVFGNLDGQNLGKIIIIASILEKEARSEEDMRLVSGIIYKRLEMNIPLQIDATVIYGACRREAAKSNFTKNCDVTFQGPAREIKIDGPYNTYMRKGLPPGPISNPGINAIKAAVNPQKSDYLYYLSSRDGSQMIYSKTSAEHAANRRKYLGI